MSDQAAAAAATSEFNSAKEKTIPSEDFILERPIGRGQFSIVYRALWVSKSINVALKRISVHQMMDQKAIEDCFKETTLLQSLDHLNVVKYFCSFMDGDELVLVLELAECGDLARMVHHFRRNRKLIPEKTIWRYFSQVSAALDHMHSKRIMHRDIKPANVFVAADGVVKLGDLGLSRFFSPKTMAAHSLVGTPYYMSPERLQEQGYTFSSDIWSLGCLLYELAALQSPFYGDRLNLYLLTRRIEQGKYPPIPNCVYSRQLSHLVSSCLKPEPQDRPTINYVYCIATSMNQQMMSRPRALSMSREHQARHSLY